MNKVGIAKICWQLGGLGRFGHLELTAKTSKDPLPINLSYVEGFRFHSWRISIELGITSASHFLEHNYSLFLSHVHLLEEKSVPCDTDEYVEQFLTVTAIFESLNLKPDPALIFSHDTGKISLPQYPKVRKLEFVYS